MQQSMTSLFLAQSCEDSWMDYQRSLLNAGFAHWDYVILTASNAQQAEGFSLQLASRRDRGLLPARTHFAALPDPEGKRVGSGGATLSVLRYIARQEGRSDFSGLRILVIHSGGDSKRVPQYSALGKLFSPVPHTLPDGRASTLFDEFMVSMASVPARIQEGMLLLSGDVLLLFNPLLIDYSGQGAAAISFKEHVSVGQNHGVYRCGENGNVARCLQKQPADVLRAAGAVNDQDCVDIDTGAVIFSSGMLRALYGLICEDGLYSGNRFDALVNEEVRLSLYADFLYPLAEESTLEEFYLEKPEGHFCCALTRARTQVWQALRPFRMKLLRLSPAKFIHFGTTGEILRLMNGEIRRYEHLQWRSCVNSCVTQEGVSGYGSILSADSRCGENVYLEVSHVHGGARIGSHVLLSYVDVDGVDVPDGVVLHGLKLRDGRFAVRIYGVNDNPKDSLEQGGTLMGVPLAEFMARNGLTAADLWPDESHSLWEAQLYPVCATIREGVEAALNLYRMTRGQGDRAAWRTAERRSLCSGFNEADPRALMEWDKRMKELVLVSQVISGIRAGTPIDDMLASPLHEAFRGQLSRIQQEWLEEQLSRAAFSEKIRLYYYIGRLLGGQEGNAFVRRCFQTIQQHLLSAHAREIRENQSLRIARDQCTVQLPLRVNFGGGWSDTPPYCNENGGAVLNAAIALKGRLPVEVTLRRLDEHRIVFDSRDMDSHGEFTDIAALQDAGNPYDPFALQKAALLTCGIIPAEGGSLEEVCTRLGGGFWMQTEVTDVPKGSGLGTSSILAAACVKALYDFLGVQADGQELISRVLILEQVMSTGGGWQDQVGGLLPGVKFITSMPGLRQDIRVQPVTIPDAALAELSDRFILIYTGQRRLARHLLRDVIGRYVGHHPGALQALDDIQCTAALMRFELERGHIDDFARLMTAHWELSKKIDSSSSNTLIEQIFSAVEEYIDGRMICGAGGGGFLQCVLKKTATRDDVRRRLREVFQDSSIDVWDCSLV